MGKNPRPCSRSNRVKVVLHNPLVRPRSEAHVPQLALNELINLLGCVGERRRLFRRKRRAEFAAKLFKRSKKVGAPFDSSNSANTAGQDAQKRLTGLTALDIVSLKKKLEKKKRNQEAKKNTAALQIPEEKDVKLIEKYISVGINSVTKALEKLVKSTGSRMIIFVFRDSFPPAIYEHIITMYHLCKNSVFIVSLSQESAEKISYSLGVKSATALAILDADYPLFSNLLKIVSGS